MLEYKWTGNGIPKLDKATNDLGKESIAHRAYRLSINKKGRKAFTQVKRNLSKQLGLTQKKTVDLGRIKVKTANFSFLSFEIKSSGSRIPLKEFNARQFSFGVRAKPWGKTRRFAGAFINAGTFASGRMVYNGHVFVRTSGASQPIRMMYGPSIPTEMVKEDSRDAFESVADELPAEINRTITKITGGVIR